MALLTLEEAACFLRVSKSTLYQRKDIPRYRLPGSRALRFDDTELIAWAKGELGDSGNGYGEGAASGEAAQGLDNNNGRVYHRNPAYR